MYIYVCVCTLCVYSQYHIITGIYHEYRISYNIQFNSNVFYIIWYSYSLLIYIPVLAGGFNPEKQSWDHPQIPKSCSRPRKMDGFSQWFSYGLHNWWGWVGNVHWKWPKSPNSHVELVNLSWRTMRLLVMSLWVCW